MGMYIQNTSPAEKHQKTSRVKVRWNELDRCENSKQVIGHKKTESLLKRCLGEYILVSKGGKMIDSKQYIRRQQSMEALIAIVENPACARGVQMQVQNQIKRDETEKTRLEHKL